MGYILSEGGADTVVPFRKRYTYSLLSVSGLSYSYTVPEKGQYVFLVRSPHGTGFRVNGADKPVSYGYTVSGVNSGAILLGLSKGDVITGTNETAFVVYRFN